MKIIPPTSSRSRPCCAWVVALTICACAQFLSGCASATSEKRVELSGIVVLKEEERQAVLEVVEPLSLETRRLVAERSEEANTDRYEADRVRRDARTVREFTPLRRFTIDYASFKNAGRGNSTTLSIRILNFVRQRVLYGKVYNVSTRWTNGEWRLTKETYPAFRGHPALEQVVQGRVVEFEVAELRGRAGFVSRGSGRLSERGDLEFDLRPFLDLGAEMERGLTFVFSIPAERLACEIVVPQEVFREVR